MFKIKREKTRDHLIIESKNSANYVFTHLIVWPWKWSQPKVIYFMKVIPVVLILQVVHAEKTKVICIKCQLSVLHVIFLVIKKITKDFLYKCICKHPTLWPLNRSKVIYLRKLIIMIFWYMLGNLWSSASTSAWFWI